MHTQLQYISRKNTGRKEDHLEDLGLDGMRTNRMDDAEVGCGRAYSELIWFVTEIRRIFVRYCEH